MRNLPGILFGEADEPDSKMRRRDLIGSMIFGIPLLSAPVLLRRSKGAPEAEALSAWLRYGRVPTGRNAQVAASHLPVFSSRPISYEFHEAIDRYLGVLESRVAAGDHASARLTFRLHSAVLPGAIRSDLNYIIGSYINVAPARFLELLAEHPHLVGNSKILLNLGLDLVDDFEGQDLEVQRRIRSIQSVVRPDLAAVQREVIEVLYSKTFHCSH